jgi:hypothetical protein
VDLVQAPLVQQGSEIEMKAQGHHCTEKNEPDSLKDIFPQE